MALAGEPIARPAPDGVAIRPYATGRDHQRIPALYAAAFGEPPWPDDWDRFPAFDPRGVFVAEALATETLVGFVTCFRRAGFGYVSVLAVVSGWRRRGVARALLGSAVGYLRSLGLAQVEVDAFTDAGPAVGLYRDFGFAVLRTYDDPQPRQAGDAATRSTEGAGPGEAQVA
jgi:ribosomal protein S18 acetylase RimI-like enzyme